MEKLNDLLLEIFNRIADLDLQARIREKRQKEIRQEYKQNLKLMAKLFSWRRDNE